MREASPAVSRFFILLVLLFVAKCIPSMLLYYELDRKGIDASIAQDRIKHIKAWLPNSEHERVYKIESEDTLEKTIMFVEDPERYFRLISDMDVTQFWENISLHDSFMREKKKAKSGFYFHERLIAFTKDLLAMRGEKVSVMTFLLLNCQSANYEQRIKDLYMHLFGLHTGLFIRQLKKREDWKRVVDELDVERAEQFKRVLRHLGKSQFEKEFRDYLLIRYPSIKEYIKK